MFYPRNTSSMIVDQYPIIDGGAMSYGPSTIITGSYTDRRKTLFLIAVGRGLRLWVEDCHRPRADVRRRGHAAV